MTADEEIKTELRAIRLALWGDPKDREDGGLIGDVRDVKRLMRGLIRFGAAFGVILLTAGAGALATRLFG